jgi:hypothetical protein
VVGDFFQLLCERLAAQRALRVRTLAHDPESDFVTARAKQLGFEVRHFRDELRLSSEQVVSALARFPEQCQVAYYDEFPTQITLRIDDAVYYNVVSATQQGRNNLTFKLDTARRGVAESILSHFEAIWRRARIVFPSSLAQEQRPSDAIK